MLEVSRVELLEVSVAEPVEVDISGGIEVGPFHYEVEVGKEASQELRGRERYGEICYQNQKIRLGNTWGQERLNETFMHEVVEAVNNEYSNSSLKHEEIVCLGNGLAQVMKSLGVVFMFGVKVRGRG